MLSAAAQLIVNSSSNVRIRRSGSAHWSKRWHGSSKARKGSSSIPMFLRLSTPHKLGLSLLLNWDPALADYKANYQAASAGKRCLIIWTPTTMDWLTIKSSSWHAAHMRILSMRRMLRTSLIKSILTTTDLSRWVNYKPFSKKNRCPIKAWVPEGQLAKMKRRSGSRLWTKWIRVAAVRSAMKNLETLCSLCYSGT